MSFEESLTTEYSGEKVALWFAESLLRGLEEKILLERQRSKTDDRREAFARRLEVAAGPLDLLLSHGFGVPAGSVRAIVTIFAKQIAPEPASLRALKLRLDILIEEPLRTGLEFLTSALRAAEGDYRMSQFCNAQIAFVRAWSLLSSERARGVIADAEWFQFTMSFPMLRAFCAAGQAGGLQDAFLLAEEPLKRLESAAEECEQTRRATENEADELKSQANAKRRELENLESFPPSQDAIDALQAEDMGLMVLDRNNPTYFMSPEAHAEWYPVKHNELEGEIKALEARREEKLSQVEICEDAARRYREIATLLTFALNDLSRICEK